MLQAFWNLTGFVEEIGLLDELKKVKLYSDLYLLHSEPCKPSKNEKVLF